PLALLQLLLVATPVLAPALLQALPQLRQPPPFGRRGLGLLADGGAVLLEGGAAGLEFVLEFQEAAAAVVEVGGELGFLRLQRAAALLEAQLVFGERGLLGGDRGGLNAQGVEGVRRRTVGFHPRILSGGWWPSSDYRPDPQKKFSREPGASAGRGSPDPA